MKRYIGSKRAILDQLFDIISVKGKGKSFLDPFSGSCAVVKRANECGYKTFSTDLNALSRELGIAFTQAGTQIKFDGILDKPANTTLKNLSTVGKTLSKNNAANEQTIFFDYYCPKGKNSEYTTIRGRTLNRNYFSPKNAAKIDNAINIVRDWWLEKKISRIELALISSMILLRMEKVANIKGTYGMPSATWEQNALTSLVFAPDLLLSGSSNTTGVVGDREDALAFAIKHQSPNILYLDPPYNFRIYMDYYHIPNFIAQYPFIDDLETYASNISFARGQNMLDRPCGKYGNRFNNASIFHNSILELIEKSKASCVVMSYFSGKNHLNEFDEEDTGASWQKIIDGLNSLDSYDSESLTTFEILRTNMQSQKGRTGKVIKEYVATINKK